jgi:ferritin-like metal-binding protein YciE
MKFNSLHEVLTDYVRDLYNAESQLVKALPKMAKAATSPDLRAAVQEHLEQTRRHVERLDRVCEDLGIKPKGKTCHAMKGLIEEGQEVISSTGDPAAKDAALIGAAQKVEHYEIAAYGTARTFARVLGEMAAADLLRQTLDEEKATDERLTALAESGLNREAAAEEVGAPPGDPLRVRNTEEFDESDEDEEDAEEAEMRAGEDDDSDAAAPTPRGAAPGKPRRRVEKTVTRRGR